MPGYKNIPSFRETVAARGGDGARGRLPPAILFKLHNDPIVCRLYQRRGLSVRYFSCLLPDAAETDYPQKGRIFLKGFIKPV